MASAVTVAVNWTMEDCKASDGRSAVSVAKAAEGEDVELGRVA